MLFKMIALVVSGIFLSGVLSIPVSSFNQPDSALAHSEQTVEIDQEEVKQQKSEESSSDVVSHGHNLSASDGYEYAKPSHKTPTKAENSTENAEPKNQLNL